MNHKSAAPGSNTNAIPGGALASPKDVLESYANGAFSDEQLIAMLSSQCRGNEDAVFGALSLLDQYHRRGLLETSLFLTAKTELNALVFGPQPMHRAEPASAKPRAQQTQHRPPPSSSSGPVQVIGPGALIQHRYVLIAPLISTANTTIFKAFDRHRAGLPANDAYVAVKCLRNAANDSARTALQTEFAAASRLSHPNILRVYDFYSDRHACITMELPPGQLLAHAIEARAAQPLPSQPWQIIRDIGLALDHAHRQGVYHGNLSANTVAMLSSGEVRVFGFAAQPDSGERGSEPRLRERGAFGEDLFALVCVAYHVLSGHEPFELRNGQPERRWRRIPNLPMHRWRTMERVLSGGETRHWRSIRDWLDTFDNTAARPTSFSAPSAQPRGAARRLAFSAATITALIVAGWMWQSGSLSSRSLQSGLFSSDTWQSGIWQSDAIPADERADDTGDIVIVAPHAGGVHTDELPASEMHASGMHDDDADIVGDADAAPTLSTPSLTPARPNDAAQGARLKTPAATRAVMRAETPALSNTQSIAPAVSRPAAKPVTKLVARPVISFIESPVVVYHGEPVAKLIVRRSGSTRDALTLHWRTTDGSAQANKEFVATHNGTAEFSPGQRTTTILIPLVRGGTLQTSQWFGVELIPDEVSDLGEIANATVFIARAETLARHID